jgi:23S rRNA pseudouridine1911/1915/1917 synthase
LGDPRDPIRIPIVHEDRSVIALDKPSGWMLVPFNWQRTQRNLQAAITSSIEAPDVWARSRNLRFLRHVHRLDAETTGVLLLARSPGAVRTYSDLFKSRQMVKTYLAIVSGNPRRTEWTCRAKLGPDPRQIGRMRIDPRAGQDAETSFRVLGRNGPRVLIEARPVTGRTHQIRLHLLDAGLSVVGDPLYGHGEVGSTLPPRHVVFPMALRAIGLDYVDPFLRRPVNIRAPSAPFIKAFGFQ